MNLQRHGSILALWHPERYPSFITTRAGNATAGRFRLSSSIGKRGLNGQFSPKKQETGESV
jgi:hypothetical protein